MEFIEISISKKQSSKNNLKTLLPDEAGIIQ